LIINGKNLLYLTHPEYRDEPRGNQGPLISGDKIMKTNTLLLLSLGLSICMPLLSVAGCGGNQQAAQKPKETTSAEIQNTIKQSFPNVTAQVSGKTITLSGTVRQPHEVSVVGSAAQGAAPGYQVVNQVRVG
jgi:hypothetical protein